MTTTSRQSGHGRSAFISLFGRRFDRAHKSEEQQDKEKRKGNDEQQLLCSEVETGWLVVGGHGHGVVQETCMIGPRLSSDGCSMVSVQAAEKAQPSSLCVWAQHQKKAGVATPY